VRLPGCLSLSFSLSLFSFFFPGKSGNVALAPEWVSLSFFFFSPGKPGNVALAPGWVFPQG
jgi:hypothetical protein